MSPFYCFKVALRVLTLTYFVVCVVCSYNGFELNRDITAKWAFLICATVAFNERYVHF
jgi:hypothetical protein